MRGWVETETTGVDLGDARLHQRMGRLLECFGDKPSVSIPAACGGWNETLAAYRFFDNAAVTAEKVLAPHRNATLTRIKEQPVVLLVQDTTELDYTGKPHTQGLGTLTYATQLGLLLHPTLAVTPQRVCLGAVEAQIWVRPAEAFGRKNSRKQRPIEEKESQRWIEGYRAACKIAEEAPNTLIVTVADREADIYELFAEAQHPQGKCAQWLVRCAHDRRLAPEGEEDPAPKLWASVSQAPVLGRCVFELPAREGRPGRTVTQTLQATRLTLRPPQRQGVRLPVVAITAVLAKEEHPPQEGDPIEWLLLTSMPVERFERAVEIVQWYLCRWQIEVYFRVLKSGCKVEELQLETTDRLKPCLALYMIVAWRVLFLTMLGRHCPELPADLVFEEAEWKTTYLVVKREPPPKKTPALNTVVAMVAQLGGYLNRANDGPPGPQTIWIGLQRVRDFILALQAHQAVHGASYV